MPIWTKGASAAEEEQQAEQEEQVLYRAVGSSEAADIMRTGTYRIAGPSAEFGKYFYPTVEQAKALVQSGWASQLTSGLFPRAAIETAEKLTLPGEGLVYSSQESSFLTAR